MKSRKNNKYLDLLLYAFFLIGVIIFIARKINTSISSDFRNFSKTEIKLSFDTLINLGKVSSASTVSFFGFIKNIGKEKLRISNLKTSCGCTNFSINNLIVLPQDSTKISFNIKTIEKGIDVVNLYFDANTNVEKYKLEVRYESVKK